MTSDSSAQKRERAVQAQQAQPQAYPTMSDCVQAAAQQNLPSSVCQQGSQLRT